MALKSYNASQHGVKVITTALHNMLCLEGEKNVIEEATIKELAAEVAEIVKTRAAQEISDSDKEVPVSLATLIQSILNARDILH